ncbi:phage/plasmid primase, P4 family [Streptomyces sp. NPDC095817]|uniref:DNA primase family protein n=1 Tax=Streptomyces sp. NPDC095817 TaxID=3155082 RepID=UPI00332AE9AF
MTFPRNQGLFKISSENFAAPIRSQDAFVPAHPIPFYNRHSSEVNFGGLLPDILTDRGNARLFVRLYARNYRYVPGIGWYRWDSTRWKVDEDDAVEWAAGDLGERIAISDPRGVFASSTLERHRRRTLSTAGIEAMLSHAKAAPEIVLHAARLDSDPHSLCTPDGIIDLRTGILRDAHPEIDFHSRATVVGPRSMPTPRWQQFLIDIFGTDSEATEMISYLQLLLGYSITGDVSAQILPFLFGTGMNGKSVLLDVVVKLLGDYADAAPPNLFMSNTDEFHPTDLAELHGRRVIVCSEIKPGEKFDEARVRRLTGGNRIDARRMRQDYFGFNPTHKIWLLGNHYPEFDTGGFTFWHRMRLIPFELVVPKERRIDNLADILVAEEGPGILRWLIDGSRRYLTSDRDLKGPARVRIGTTAYAAKGDHVSRFYEERCHLAPNLRAEQTKLYNAYKAWCNEQGVPVMSSRNFASRTREIVGVTSPKKMILSNQRKHYPGIGLLSDEDRES